MVDQISQLTEKKAVEITSDILDVKSEIKLSENVLNYADLILEYLNKLGVEYIFGVPGGAIEPLFDALARSARSGGPEVIIARHECGAAFMADGYHRETGKLGVVCSTTGPGATNLITGVATASVDKIPMLVITAQTALPKFGKRALQDSSETAIDTVGIFRNCTKFNALISHEMQLESKLISALMEAIQSPKGPVHLSIPSDIFRMPCRRVNPNVHVNYLMNKASLEDTVAVEELMKIILNVDKVVLFVGHGCGRAYNEIQQLAEVINAPFVSGPMGKRWVNEKHPLYRGVYGYAGHQSARDLFNNDEIDLILAFGASITEMGLGGLDNKILSEKLVHIDSSVESFSRSPMARLHVCGHLNGVINRLLNKIAQQSWRRTWDGVEVECDQNILGGFTPLIDEEKCISNAIPIKPQRLMGCLTNRLPENTRIFIDTGNIWAWATHYLNVADNHGMYRVSMGFGSMAWSIGAVIGSAFASKKKLEKEAKELKVLQAQEQEKEQGKENEITTHRDKKPNPLVIMPHICLVGDGAWLMSSHEIGVAVQHNLPILFIVLNDSAFGMIRYGQKLSNAESIGWKLNEVDFSMLAMAQGAMGKVIEDPEQLDKLNFDEIFSADGPTLLDVRIDPNEEPPMKVRVASLKEGDSNATGYN